MPRTKHTRKEGTIAVRIRRSAYARLVKLAGSKNSLTDVASDAIMGHRKGKAKR